MIGLLVIYAYAALCFFTVVMVSVTFDFDEFEEKVSRDKQLCWLVEHPSSAVTAARVTGSILLASLVWPVSMYQLCKS